MRYSSTHREETFNRIVKAASQLFNERGYHGIGVDGIMKAVGLTAGGFYAHFRSKDALLAKALEASLSRFHGVLLAGLESASGASWSEQVIRRYLSRQHRDSVADGCALPSLASDVARGKASARKIFEDHFLKLIDEAVPKLAETSGDAEEARDRALAILAMMVGGVLLSRAVRSEELSDRILLASRVFATAVADPAEANARRSTSSKSKSRSRRNK